MRHKVAGKGFGRNTNQRKALLRGLVISLFEHLKIETTLAKAKEARKIAERLITFGKKGDLNSRRVVLARIPNKKAVARLFGDIAPKLSGRNGGYLRIVKTRVRPGDNSSMAVLEFSDYEILREKKAEKGEKKKAKEEKKTTKEEKA
ncbi:MAG: 50S ribosomal protein L17 [Nitrospirae bacterium]|nr:50S ribosomal protein L17 [Nitrospirota bacterium]